MGSVSGKAEQLCQLKPAQLNDGQGWNWHQPDQPLISHPFSIYADPRSELRCWPSHANIFKKPGEFQSQNSQCLVWFSPKILKIFTFEYEPDLFFWSVCVCVVFSCLVKASFWYLFVNVCWSPSGFALFRYSVKLKRLCVKQVWFFNLTPG